MRRWIISILILLVPMYISAQVMLDEDNQRVDERTDSSKGWNSKKKDSDKKKKEPTPTGLKVWQADDRFGTIDSVKIDTFSHHFQNSNFTEGVTGQYNSLGNMGSPRLSRLFSNRKEDFSYFIFADPYDFFITPFSQIHFTNTKSPITNITYHETLSSENGEDRIKALYAVNMDKDVGFGLKLDYLYGRGYYNYQSTSNFNFTFTGSILKERYQAHFALYTNYLKTSENGGITDDQYVTNPENFPSSYGTSDIPTNLDKAWNKMHVNGVQWTHRYSIGFRKLVEESDTTKKDLQALTLASDSMPRHAQNIPFLSDTLTQKDSIVPPKTIFVPVTSFIHTLKVERNSRDFIANESLSDFYTNQYFEGDSTLDKFSNTFVSNLLAIELREGFNKWALAGVRLYAQHDFNNYKFPSSRRLFETFSENRITLGGQIFKENSKTFRYNLQAETSSDGNSFGDFKLSGKGRLNMNLLGDSIALNVYGSVINREPTFFYRRFQSQYLWWNNNLDKQFTTHIGANLQSKKTRTRLSFDLQNIKNYTYFANTESQVVGESSSYSTNNTSVQQYSDNIQILELRLNQDFKLGILNWENEIAYQKTSNADVLPLPELSLYSNLYLLFHIAKVLRVEFGGDVRYFSSYYAPTYSPAIGQYTLQDATNRIKIGNYPTVDIYANCHLKHTRFYVMASHVNYSKSSNGSKFLAPHYPINPFIIRMGLSWNFFN